MKAGLIVNQGNLGDFNGWEPRRAWDRSMAIARLAEDLGFDALWAPDHVMNLPGHRSGEGLDFTLDPFVQLSGIAAVTSRVTLGHLVMCAPFRHPALVAKALSTLDVASGGRVVCAVGAGWHRPEFDAYGIPFPSTAERLAILREHLEVLTRMFGPGRSTFEGERVRVVDSPNEPPSADAGRRIPIIVGGNGPQVTWRLAARYADELNLDALLPDEIAAALPVIAARCEEIDRDPATLRVSALGDLPADRNRRLEDLARIRELGLVRLDLIDRRIAESDEPLLAYAEELHATGVELADAPPDE